MSVQPPSQTALPDRTGSGLPDDLGQIDSLIFDLDGTLWDTCEICAQGWNNVIEKHRMPFRKVTTADVRSVAGKPHEVCVREVCVGLSEQQIKTLSAESETEDNRLIAERGGTLYPGVAAELQALAARYPLFIVSNCQAGYIEIFMGWTGLGPLFRDYECWGNTGLSKAENLRAVIGRNVLRAPLFVGDTPGDHAAARANGVPFVFASYGFGQCLEPRPAATIATFAELSALLRLG